MKRKKKNVNRFIKLKKRTYWPMIYCPHENKAIAISHYRCKKKVKVQWYHFDVGRCEFLHGYEFSMKNLKKGDIVYCPKCKHRVDFRMWLSDTLPHIIQEEK